MNNEPDYKDNLYFERTNKMDININTNDLLKNEQFVFALATELADRIYHNKAYDQFFSDDWNSEFAKMVKDHIADCIEKDIKDYISGFDITRAFSNALYTKLSNIIDEIKKTQDTLDICF